MARVPTAITGTFEVGQIFFRIIFTGRCQLVDGILYRHAAVFIKIKCALRCAAIFYAGKHRELPHCARDRANFSSGTTQVAWVICTPCQRATYMDHISISYVTAPLLRCFCCRRVDQRLCLLSQRTTRNDRAANFYFVRCCLQAFWLRHLMIHHCAGARINNWLIGTNANRSRSASSCHSRSPFFPVLVS